MFKSVFLLYLFSSVQFSHSVMSYSLRPHELQHTRPPCPSPTPRVYPNSHPSSQWCHPAIWSSVVPFSSCPQSLPASGSFPMSQLFAWGVLNGFKVFKVEIDVYGSTEAIYFKTITLRGSQSSGPQSLLGLWTTGQPNWQSFDPYSKFLHLFEEPEIQHHHPLSGNYPIIQQEVYIGI